MAYFVVTFDLSVFRHVVTATERGTDTEPIFV